MNIHIDITTHTQNIKRDKLKRHVNVKRTSRYILLHRPRHTHTQREKTTKSNYCNSIINIFNYHHQPMKGNETELVKSRKIKSNSGAK